MAPKEAIPWGSFVCGNYEGRESVFVKYRSLGKLQVALVLLIIFTGSSNIQWTITITLQNQDFIANHCIMELHSKCVKSVIKRYTAFSVKKNFISFL